MNIHQIINARAEESVMDSLAPLNGKIFIYVSTTDCDHCTRTYTRMMNATAFDAFENYLYDSAEGATYVHRLTPRQYANRAPASWRDGIAEAHEDGHAHCVYG
jgi:hypothetical protein